MTRCAEQALMANVASEVTARLSSAESSAFSRQHLANLIWSFATLEVSATFLKYMPAPLHANLGCLSACMHFSISTCTIWQEKFPSLRRLYLQLDPGAAMLRAVANAMAERASNCNPQEISNTVWAYAKLRKLLLTFIVSKQTSQANFW